MSKRTEFQNWSEIHEIEGNRFQRCVEPNPACHLAGRLLGFARVIARIARVDFQNPNSRKSHGAKGFRHFCSDCSGFMEKRGFMWGPRIYIAFLFPKTASR
jgi:hypothetical protein